MAQPVTNKTSAHGPSFTAADFARSMNDKPQWFDSYKRYAIGIGCNIGVKPLFIEDMAVDALFHLYSQLCKFDSGRGDFKSFFNTCVRNFMLDYERHITGGKDALSSACVNESDALQLYEGKLSSDDDGASVIKRKEFLEGLLNECKIFINALSLEQKRIIYASDFGKMVDDTADSSADAKSRKDYAKELAERTGRTVEAIRKTASRLKQDAISHAMTHGYGKEQYYGIGFLIVQDPKPNHFADFDWSRMTDLYLFKLRRFIYEKAVSDGFFCHDRFS